jgi:serine/threonine protein kinase
MSLDESQGVQAGSAASQYAGDAAALTRAAQTALVSGNGEGSMAITGHGTAVTSSKKAFTVYIINVHASNGAAWTVYRRYSQFKALSDKIHSRMGARLDFRVREALPPKKMIGSSNPEFVRQRRRGLAEWLQLLLTAFRRLGMPPFANEDLRHFVTHDANKPPAQLKIASADADSGAADASTAAASGAAAAGGGTGAPQGETLGRDIRPRRVVSLEDFEMIKVIGKGSFGKVLLVRKRDSRNLFAMKVLDKKNIIRRNQVEHTNTERRVLGQIRHPFIVTLHYAFQTRTRLYFVLDYCSGGELFFHLGRCGRLRESLACFYAAEITLALAHLHSLGIVYRDLKPENILLDGDGHVRLADFGLSKEGITAGTTGTGSFCGTAEYLAPEILNRTGHGTGVDWWALGMVLYEMLTGMPPWYTKEREVLFERVRRSPLEFPKHVSPNAKSLIQGFLVRDSAKRIGVRLGAQEVMAQPFFAHIDWRALYERRLAPPFRPRKDVGSLDASNFDKVFTRMRIEVPTGPSSIAGSNTFAGFSFEGHIQDRRAREREQREQERVNSGGVGSVPPQVPGAVDSGAV